MYAKTLAAAVLGLGAVCASGSALAAPQVLGLIAMAEPMTMQCDRHSCVAELNSFCLEKDRAAPTKGTGYSIVAGEGVILTGVLDDGRTLTLDGVDMTLKAFRGHSTVLASIPRSVLTEHGVDSVTVQVGLKTALVPEPMIADPDPHTPAEIAKAIGPLRLLGSQIVDSDVRDTLAADFANRLINNLPMTARVSQEERDGLWNATHGGRDFSPALERVQGIFEQCQRNVYLGNQRTMRGCLSRHRDFWLNKKTQEYWSGAAGG